MIVHGGAGGPRARDEVPRYLREIENAVKEGLEALRSGSSLEGVQAAVEYMEETEVFNAGRGSSLTSDGRLQLDAAVMVGRGLKGGAVGACECTYHAARLARAVMETTNHLLIVGDDCKRVASEAGLSIEKLQPTQSVLDRLRREAIGGGKSGAAPGPSHGTVGAVALDLSGVPAAAVSTGGIWLKKPGRVGDSAIIGAGIYADEAAGAACATGIGEEIIRNALSWEACRLMKRSGAMAAARRAIEQVSKRSGTKTAGIITVDMRGGIGFAHNTAMMGRGWLDNRRDRIVVELR
jgi:beta-aspartyl-peptidase (threonine type)